MLIIQPLGSISTRHKKSYARAMAQNKSKINEKLNYKKTTCLLLKDNNILYNLIIH